MSLCGLFYLSLYPSSVELRSVSDLPGLADSVVGLESIYLVGEMLRDGRMACEFSTLELKKGVGK